MLMVKSGDGINVARKKQMKREIKRNEVKDKNNPSFSITRNKKAISGNTVENDRSAMLGPTDARLTNNNNISEGDSLKKIKDVPKLRIDTDRSLLNKSKSMGLKSPILSGKSLNNKSSLGSPLTATLNNGASWKVKLPRKSIQAEREKNTIKQSTSSGKNGNYSPKLLDDIGAPFIPEWMLNVCLVTEENVPLSLDQSRKAQANALLQSPRTKPPSSREPAKQFIPSPRVMGTPGSNTPLLSPLSPHIRVRSFGSVEQLELDEEIARFLLKYTAPEGSSPEELMNLNSYIKNILSIVDQSEMPPPMEEMGRILEEGKAKGIPISFLKKFFEDSFPDVPHMDPSKTIERVESESSIYFLPQNVVPSCSTIDSVSSTELDSYFTKFTPPLGASLEEIQSLNFFIQKLHMKYGEPRKNEKKSMEEMSSSKLEKSPRKRQPSREELKKFILDNIGIKFSKDHKLMDGFELSPRYVDVDGILDSVSIDDVNALPGIKEEMLQILNIHNRNNPECDESVSTYSSRGFITSNSFFTLSRSSNIGLCTSSHYTNTDGEADTVVESYRQNSRCLSFEDEDELESFTSGASYTSNGTYEGRPSFSPQKVNEMKMGQNNCNFFSEDDDDVDFTDTDYSCNIEDIEKERLHEFMREVKLYLQTMSPSSRTTELRELIEKYLDYDIDDGTEDHQEIISQINVIIHNLKLGFPLTHTESKKRENSGGATPVENVTFSRIHDSGKNYRPAIVIDDRDLYNFLQGASKAMEFDTKKNEVKQEKLKNLTLNVVEYILNQSVRIERVPALTQFPSFSFSASEPLSMYSSDSLSPKARDGANVQERITDHIQKLILDAPEIPVLDPLVDQYERLSKKLVRYGCVPLNCAEGFSSKDLTTDSNSFDKSYVTTSTTTTQKITQRKEDVSIIIEEGDEGSHILPGEKGLNEVVDDFVSNVVRHIDYRKRNRQNKIDQLTFCLKTSVEFVFLSPNNEDSIYEKASNLGITYDIMDKIFAHELNAIGVRGYERYAVSCADNNGQAFPSPMSINSKRGSRFSRSLYRKMGCELNDDEFDKLLNESDTESKSDNICMEEPEKPKVEEDCYGARNGILTRTTFRPKINEFEDKRKMLIRTVEYENGRKGNRVNEVQRIRSKSICEDDEENFFKDYFQALIKRQVQPNEEDVDQILMALNNHGKSLEYAMSILDLFQPSDNLLKLLDLMIKAERSKTEELVIRVQESRDLSQKFHEERMFHSSIRSTNLELNRDIICTEHEEFMVSACSSNDDSSYSTDSDISGLEEDEVELKYPILRRYVDKFLNRLSTLRHIDCSVRLLLRKCIVRIIVTVMNERQMHEDLGTEEKLVIETTRSRCGTEGKSLDAAGESNDNQMLEGDSVECFDAEDNEDPAIYSQGGEETIIESFIGEAEVVADRIVAFTFPYMCGLARSFDSEASTVNEDYESEAVEEFVGLLLSVQQFDSVKEYSDFIVQCIKYTLILGKGRCSRSEVCVEEMKTMYLEVRKFGLSSDTFLELFGGVFGLKHDTEITFDDTNTDESLKKLSLIVQDNLRKSKSSCHVMTSVIGEDYPSTSQLKQGKKSENFSQLTDDVTVETKTPEYDATYIDDSEATPNQLCNMEDGKTHRSIWEHGITVSRSGSLSVPNDEKFIRTSDEIYERDIPSIANQQIEGRSLLSNCYKTDLNVQKFSSVQLLPSNSVSGENSSSGAVSSCVEMVLNSPRACVANQTNDSQTQLKCVAQKVNMKNLLLHFKFIRRPKSSTLFVHPKKIWALPLVERVRYHDGYSTIDKGSLLDSTKVYLNHKKDIPTHKKKSSPHSRIRNLEAQNWFGEFVYTRMNKRFSPPICEFKVFAMSVKNYRQPFPLLSNLNPLLQHRLEQDADMLPLSNPPNTCITNGRQLVGDWEIANNDGEIQEVIRIRRGCLGNCIGGERNFAEEDYSHDKQPMLKTNSSATNEIGTITTMHVREDKRNNRVHYMYNSLKKTQRRKK